MSSKIVSRVQRIALRYLEEQNYSSMSEFNSEDIENIASQARVDFTEVVDILAPELM